MKDRLELHEELCGLLGSRNVYFHPSTNTSIKYPCIVYKLDGIDSKFANNKRYTKYGVYTITHVYRESKHRMLDEILDHFDFIDLTNKFTSDGLNHDVFKLYY
jgi:hypothetical protein